MFTAVQTYERFQALTNKNEHCIYFILDTKLIYTHGIFINSAVYGTESTSSYIELTIGNQTKQLSLHGHTHSNYYANNSNINIDSYKIVSGNKDLLLYSSGTIIGDTSTPISMLSNTALTTTRNDSTYTILDTGNFSITTPISGATSYNTMIFNYGSNSLSLYYIRRLNRSSSFDDLKSYTAAGTNIYNGNTYGFITFFKDNDANSTIYALLRINTSTNVLETRTSGSSNWKAITTTLLDMTINGTVYSIATSENSLPSFYAPTSLSSTGGYILATNSGATGLEWIAAPTPNVSTSAVVTNSNSSLTLYTSNLANPFYNLIEGTSLVKSIQFNGTNGISVNYTHNSDTAGIITFSYTDENIKVSTLTSILLTTSWSNVENLTTKLGNENGSYLILLTYGSRMYTGYFSYVYTNDNTYNEEEIILHCSGNVETTRGRLYARICRYNDNIYLGLASALSENNASITIKYNKLL